MCRLSLIYIKHPIDWVELEPPIFVQCQPLYLIEWLMGYFASFHDSPQSWASSQNCFSLTNSKSQNFCLHHIRGSTWWWLSTLSIFYLFIYSESHPSLPFQPKYFSSIKKCEQPSFWSSKNVQTSQLNYVFWT